MVGSSKIDVIDFPTPKGLNPSAQGRVDAPWVESRKGIGYPEGVIYVHI